MRRVAVDDTAGWVRACGVADLIWLESPSNPLLTVADLEAVCAAPRKAGAIVAVDSTFATPLNQLPLAFGATVSLQSATKFIGGHSDLLAGVATTRDGALWHALKKSRELTGATPGTLEAFLAVRGARTLALRLQRAQQTAMMLAERLEMHPLVTRVRYPGLPSHPTHATAKRVLKGSFRSICLEELSLRIVSVETSGSFAMPPVSEQWNQRWNEELRSQDRGTYHLRSYESVLVLKTPTISGSISIRPSARLRHDAVGSDATILQLKAL